MEATRRLVVCAGVFFVMTVVRVYSGVLRLQVLARLISGFSALRHSYVVPEALVMMIPMSVFKASRRLCLPASGCGPKRGSRSTGAVESGPKLPCGLGLFTGFASGVLT